MGVPVRCLLEKANFSLPQVRGRIKDTKNKRLLIIETNSSLKCQSIIQKSTKKKHNSSKNVSDLRVK